MHMRKIAIGLVCCFGLLHANMLVAGGPSIGVVDFNKVVETSVPGKALQDRVAAEGGKIRAEIEKSQADIVELQETYQREAPLWTASERAEKERLFKSRIEQFNTMKLTKEKDFNAFRVNLINEMKQQLVGYIETIAEKEGYWLVIEKRTGTVIYSRDPVDLTDRLISEFDQAAGRKK
jgi:outer membrane protein